MTYKNNFMSLSIKELPFNTQNNFLFTLQKLQTTSSLLAPQEEIVTCESKYLKSLQKVNNNSLNEELVVGRLEKIMDKITDKLSGTRLGSLLGFTTKKPQN